MPLYGSYPDGAPAQLADKALFNRGALDYTLTVQTVLEALHALGDGAPAVNTDELLIYRAGGAKKITIATLMALAGGGGVGHNYLINGAFDIAQRGTSYVATTTGAYGCVDRWYMGQNPAGATFSQAAPSPALPGFKNCLKILQTNASVGVIFWGQVIESIDVSALQGQTVVVSFRALKGATWNPANLRVRIITGTGVDQGQTALNNGTWTAQANTLDTNVNPTNAWQTFSATVLIPNGCTELALHCNATPTGGAVDANSYLMMTGVDIRVGTAAPAYRDSRPRPLELELCKWFYRRINGDPANNIYVAGGQAYSTTQAIFPVPESFNMRKAPALSFSAVADLVGFFGGSPFASTAATIGGSADLSAITQTIGSSSYTVNGAPLLYLAAGAGKFLGLDAELN